MKNFFILILILMFSLGFSGLTFPGEKYWVYFSDKGYSASTNLAKKARTTLSEKAIQRRILRGEPGKIFDVSDLPVYPVYIDEIRNLGIQVLQKSRWLNAISIIAEQNQVEQINYLPSVKKVSPVLTFVRNKDEEPKKVRSFNKVKSSFNNIYDYGLSTDQIELINVAALHNSGYTGNGILITLIDTGFNHQLHEAFKHLNIVAERDFINHDNITRNEDGQDSQSQHNHGTRVLSLIGSFLPSQIIGPAFGAQFAFAKTEYVSSETRVEEDNWVTAIEWADSLGSDIVSTSLGYLDFDGGFTYTYEDLNGETMVTSIAAKMAVEKGIVVVSSAGNEGNDKDWPYILSPADGFGVIAAGAVNSSGVRASFSSIGPTADGRIKPDLMAMGSGNTLVNPNAETGFSFGGGTSYSAPLVAGVCALLLEINPQLTPYELEQALKSTASQTDAPDNFMGWGIIDAQAAANQIESNEIPGEMPNVLKLYPSSINLVAEFTCFCVDLPVSDFLKISIYNSLGQKIDQHEQFQFAGRKKGIIWNWSNQLSAGIYFAKFELKQKVATQKFIIYR